MFFNYSDSFYVSDEDFDEMLRYMEKGRSAQLALSDWASGLDDSDFFIVGKIVMDIIAELERRARK